MFNLENKDYTIILSTNIKENKINHRFVIGVNSNIKIRLNYYCINTFWRNVYLLNIFVFQVEVKM